MSDLSLHEFRIYCRDVLDRDGGPIYDVRVYCLRDNQWVMAGVLNLRAQEWLRLKAVCQAHEAQHGPVQTHVATN